MRQAQGLQRVGEVPEIVGMYLMRRKTPEGA
jgi:hypothetical protein